MADRPMVSSAALVSLHAHLPSGLDERQVEAVIAAAEELAQVVWAEATRAAGARNSIRNDFRREQREKDQRSALADAFDAGWESHRQEALAQEKDPSYPIRRDNPWREAAGRG